MHQPSTIIILYLYLIMTSSVLYLAMLEAQGLPPHLLGALGSKMQYILQRSFSSSISSSNSTYGMWDSEQGYSCWYDVGCGSGWSYSQCDVAVGGVTPSVMWQWVESPPV